MNSVSVTIQFSNQFLIKLFFTVSLQSLFQRAKKLERFTLGRERWLSDIIVWDANTKKKLTRPFSKSGSSTFTPKNEQCPNCTVRKDKEVTLDLILFQVWLKSTRFTPGREHWLRHTIVWDTKTKNQLCLKVCLKASWETRKVDTFAPRKEHWLSDAPKSECEHCLIARRKAKKHELWVNFTIQMRPSSFVITRGPARFSPQSEHCAFGCIVGKFYDIFGTKVVAP